MAREIVQIPFKKKIVKLIFDEFEDEIDVDQLTFIDYANLHAEFLTISSLYNRVGMWKAEAQHAYDRAVLHRKIQEAEKGEHYRKKLKRVDEYANGKPKTVWPTKDEVENAVTLDELIQNLHKKEIRLKKEYGYMDSLFWAVKSKEKKVEKLVEGAGLKPDDFESSIIEGRWNGILIRCQEKLIK